MSHVVQVNDICLYRNAVCQLEARLENHCLEAMATIFRKCDTCACVGYKIIRIQYVYKSSPHTHITMIFMQCMYIYIYLYTYICLYIYIYIYIDILYMCTGIYTCIDVYMYVHICMYIHVYTSKHVYAYISRYMRIYIYMCIHICIYIYTHIHVIYCYLPRLRYVCTGVYIHS